MKTTHEVPMSMCAYYCKYGNFFFSCVGALRPNQRFFSALALYPANMQFRVAIGPPAKRHLNGISPAAISDHPLLRAY